MFIGHYGAAFGLKAAEKRVPLWLLFLAVQAIDIAWAVLTYFGIEKFRIVPGFLALSPLDLYYMPWTHGLDTVLLWSVLSALLYHWLRRQDGWPAAWTVGGAVFSHWILDLLVHAPDLPLVADHCKVGFGLWAYPVIGTLLEAAVLFGGLAFYLRGLRKGRIGFVVFALVLEAMQLLSIFGPPPKDLHGEELLALVFYFGLAAIAWWLERRSEVDRRAVRAASAS